MINATRVVLINNSNIVFAVYRIELPNLITFFAIKLYMVPDVHTSQGQMNKIGESVNW